MEKIKVIVDVQEERMSGFIVITDKQQIRMMIDNSHYCCENFGYFITNDNYEEFVDAELLSVELVKECLDKTKAPDIYDGGIMFVNLNTDKGTLQFVAYNEHNGYYGHQAKVECTQLNYDTYL